MIRFDQVSFAYNARPVIDAISFTIRTGESVAVMGRNGCGKTTLGYLLAGILKPHSGTITIDNHISTTDDGDRPAIGFLFQDPDNGLVATTVEREVAFSLENISRPPDEIQATVDVTLDLFRMESLRHRLVWTLSGGEKQRLALAGVIAFGPRILFLDEPASFLDYPGSRRLDTAVERIKDTYPDVSVIRVTQYPSVADRFERVLLMDSGRIISDETPDAIFSDRGVLRRCGLRPPLRYFAPRVEDVPEKREQKTRHQNEVLVELSGIEFGYGDDLLFDGLDLSIFKGEVLGVVGPSGSGKSTLAQILCKIYQPQAGRIEWFSGVGRVVMSFQQPERQFFLSTCYDEILYGIKTKYESNTLRVGAISASMSMAGLDYYEFKDRDPHSLSGGEARRLAFAIVLALDADLMIFDEPTCGLDEDGIQSFRRMVRELIASGKTVMLISHNSDIVADMSDRIVLLSDGKVVSTSEPLEFFQSEHFKEILSLPEVIDYQRNHYGEVVTTRLDDIFSEEDFCT